MLEKSDLDLHLLLILEGEPSKIYQPFSNQHVHVNSHNAEYHHTPFLENTDCLETRLLSSERLQSKEHQDIAATLPNVLSFKIHLPNQKKLPNVCLTQARLLEKPTMSSRLRLVLQPPSPGRIRLQRRSDRSVRRLQEVPLQKAIVSVGGPKTRGIMYVVDVVDVGLM